MHITAFMCLDVSRSVGEGFFCFRGRDWEQGRIQRFSKEGVTYVGHHGWLTKKILGFRWSKKAKTMLETKVFGETFLSVFSNFLHLMKAFR